MYIHNAHVSFNHFLTHDNDYIIYKRKEKSQGSYQKSYLGAGEIKQYDAKISKEYLCSHNYNIALIKQISLFYTALVMKNTFKKLK